MSPMPVKAKVVHVQFPHRDDYKSRRKTMPVPGWWVSAPIYFASTNF